MPSDIEVYIVMTHVGNGLHGPEGQWQIWVEDEGVYIAEYRCGALLITPEMSPVLLESLSGQLGSIMRTMNPQYQGSFSPMVVNVTDPPKPRGEAS